MRPWVRSVGDVAGDVGELQRDAEVHRVVAPARVPAAEDVEADESDGRGHPPAGTRAGRRRWRSACARGPSARRPPGPRTPGAAAHSEPPPAAAPCLARDSGLAAVEHAGDLAAPEAQLVGGVAGTRRLVHRVVDGPTGVPHRDDRVALGLGQDQERVVEGGVAAHSSVLHPTTRASATPSVGRAATGSNPPCSSRSSTRDPPCHVARSSQRSRPRTWSRSGWPASKSARVRVVQAARACRHSARRRRRPGREIVEPGAGGAPFRLRHVEPAARPVDGEVLPEVGELQRGADRVGPAVEPLVVVAEQAQHQSSDRIRRPPAVVVDLGPRAIAGDGHVLPERRQQRFEQGHREVEASARCGRAR